jgi:hypothetical protein
MRIRRKGRDEGKKGKEGQEQRRTRGRNAKA